MNVLDLPIEKQEELAKRMGRPHKLWVEDVKRRLKEGDEFLEKVKEVEAKGGNMTPEERERFQRKMDSANPQ